MKILMVCLGNICRSPMAEEILREKAKEGGINLTVDSAGTNGFHTGQHPDKRAVLTAKKFGVDISKLVARKFLVMDFDSFDRIYVMDSSNYTDVVKLAGNAQQRSKVDYLLNACMPGSCEEVPDPYYGGADGFIEVFRMMEKACDCIVEEFQESLKFKV